MNYYGQIDLTLLGHIVRTNPDLIKKVTFKDGKEHQLINIGVYERKQQSQHGSTHYIKVSCEKDKQVEGCSYYISDLKPSTLNNNDNGNKQQVDAQPQSIQFSEADPDELPF